MHRGCQERCGFGTEPASSGWVNLLLTGFPRVKDTQERADNKRTFRRLWKAPWGRQPGCKVCTVASRYFAVSGVLGLKASMSRQCGRAARVFLICARVCLFCGGSFPHTRGRITGCLRRCTRRRRVWARL